MLYQMVKPFRTEKGEPGWAQVAAGCVGNCRRRGQASLRRGTGAQSGGSEGQSCQVSILSDPRPPPGPQGADGTFPMNPLRMSQLTLAGVGVLGQLLRCGPGREVRKISPACGPALRWPRGCLQKEGWGVSVD